MLRLPPLNTLRSFEAAARTGSFSQAAEELAVTASAVSHQIKSLENYLGVILFYRKKRKAELTDSGEKYLTSITHALREIASATEQLKSRSGTDVITISIINIIVSADTVSLLVSISIIISSIISNSSSSSKHNNNNRKQTITNFHFFGTVYKIDNETFLYNNFF